MLGDWKLEMKTWEELNKEAEENEEVNKPLVPVFPEWELKACDKCLQMTDHEKGKCLKCRAKEIREADQNGEVDPEAAKLKKHQDESKEKLYKAGLQDLKKEVEQM